jgi:hypothetical protein
MFRRLRSAAFPLALALAFGFGCQHTERPDGDAEDAGSSPDSALERDGSRPSFASGACYACTSTACRTQVGVCNGEPSCAAYLSCVGACPARADGTAEPACVAACPPAAGSTPEAAQAAVDGCLGAAVATCAPCGGGVPEAGVETGFKHPALRQQCEPSNESDPCIRCQYDNCCESVSAAFDTGGAAVELTDCWLACETTDCEQGCYDRYRDQIPAFGGYDACLGSRCIATEACPTQGSGCSACVHRACAEEQAACLTNTDCFLARACIGACPNADPTCGVNCRARYPDGAVYLDPLLVCGGQHCIEICGG